VSSKLPTREQALKILRQNHCSPNVIAHCKAVAKLSVETAIICQEKGLKINLALVEAGALLHDLGRSKTHSVNHAIVGAEIAKKAGLPESIIYIIKRHVGGGITNAEAKELGWPEDNYVPMTLEEKIVSYADKLVETSKRVPIEMTINKLKEEKLETAATKVRELHDEIEEIVGDHP
jgi:uncharacterized protein